MARWAAQVSLRSVVIVLFTVLPAGYSERAQVTKPASPAIQQRAASVAALFADVNRGELARLRSPEPLATVIARRQGTNASNETQMTLAGGSALLQEDGRCDSALNMLDQFAACSGNVDAVSCVNNTNCVWKLANDTLNYSCYCSFTDCKCGDPAEGSYQSEEYSESSMTYIVIPIMLSVACVSIAGCFHWQRERLAWLFGIVLPDFVLKKFAIDDDHAKIKKQKEAARAQDLDEEDEDNDFRRALDAWANSGLPPQGEFTLTLMIERALHLPIMDSALRDANLVGSCDPYVRMTVGGYSKETTVKQGTLYPVWDEDFDFFLDRDHPRRRPQVLLLEVYDWDLGKRYVCVFSWMSAFMTCVCAHSRARVLTQAYTRSHRDDFVGKIELSVAELIESYESRKDRQRPYDAWHRLQIRGSNNRPVREPSGRTGHKPGHAPFAELHFNLSVDRCYDLRQSTADMRRAVNYIRHTKREAAKQHLMAVNQKDAGVAWDEHTNTKRWDAKATTLRTGTNHAWLPIDDSISEETGAGVGSRFAIDRLPPGNTQGRKGRMRLADYFRKNYDLWGVKNTIDKLQNPFLQRAAEVKAAKLEAINTEKEDLRDVDEQFRDAIFIEDLDKLQRLIDTEGGSAEHRSTARLMIKQAAIRAKEAFGQQARAQMANEEEASPGSRTLVCVCQPQVFLDEGRCMCGFDTMLSQSQREDVARARAAHMAAGLELLDEHEMAGDVTTYDSDSPRTDGRRSNLSTPAAEKSVTKEKSLNSVEPGGSGGDGKLGVPSEAASTPVSIGASDRASPAQRETVLTGIGMGGAEAVFVTPASGRSGVPRQQMAHSTAAAAAAARQAWKAEQKSRKTALQQNKAQRKSEAKAKAAEEQVMDAKKSSKVPAVLTVSLQLPKGSNAGNQRRISIR